MFTVARYRTVQGNCPYETFFRKLSPEKRRAVEAACELLEEIGPALPANPRHARNLRGGLFELKTSVSSGVALRIFYAAQPGGSGFVLLGGYDKGRQDRRKAQDEQIRRARDVLAQMLQER